VYSPKVAPFFGGFFAVESSPDPIATSHSLTVSSAPPLASKLPRPPPA
jgi:hypothetical protein